MELSLTSQGGSGGVISHYSRWGWWSYLSLVKVGIMELSLTSQGGGGGVISH